MIKIYGVYIKIYLRLVFEFVCCYLVDVSKILIVLDKG